MSAGRAVILAALCLLFLACPAWGTNSIWITSATVSPNQTDVEIPVMVENDVALRAFVLPVVIHTTSGGAYIQAAQVQYRDRLATYLTEIQYLNHYNHGISDTAACKRFMQLQPKAPGGFIGQPEYNGPLKQVVTGVPYGISTSCTRIFSSNLPSGADATGSVVYTFDIGPQEGVFEIDTTCMDPALHVLFVDPSNLPVMPVFTKGVVTVASPGGNTPPIASDDVKGARAGVTLYVVGAGVLTNDSDPDGDPMTAVLETDVSHGVLDLHSDGSFFYTPSGGYNGIDQFTYFANDGLANSALPAAVTLYVKSYGPAAAGDYDEDGELTAIDLGALIDALFCNGPDPTDGGCRDWPRGDLDCDQYSTALDMARMIDYLFAGGVAPCDPCDF